MLPDHRDLKSDEWPLLRQARLRALKDSPQAFLATYAKEVRYGEDRWLAEFERGDWIVGEAGGEPVCLVGVTREPGAPDSERYLEYVWVASTYRRSGVALAMLKEIIENLKVSGVRTVFLWVLGGNEPALRLYEQLHFVSTSEKGSLEDFRPGCWEERFRRDLA
jgi:ribosomal protein S18 acetylase RimI-like enzyme